MSSSRLLRHSPAQLLVLSVAIFFIALLPRLGALERYVTPDELRWVDRSIRFADALSRGAWASTIQSGHPGVMTMWLGSLGIGLRYGRQPVSATEYDPQNPVQMRQLAQFLTAARVPVIFVIAINLVVLFLLLERLIDRRAAFLAAGLIALDPFAVALGSILHVDMLMTTFSLTALAALAIAMQRDRSTRWFILSGVLSGLAMLSKSPAVVLSVATFMVVVADGLRQRRSMWQVIRRLLIWGISAAAIFFLVYPAMWAAPVKTVLRMRTTAENFSETAHAVNFFNGSNARDPGPLFYPVVLAFRSTPVLWLGLIAGVILIVRAQSEEEKHRRSITWVYWVFAIVFVGVITLGAKKLDRYVLPALEALMIVSALGLAYAIEHSGARLRTRQRLGFLNSAVAALLLVSAFQFALVWPMPLRAFNLALGGYDRAKSVLPVGGGESAEVGQTLAHSPYAAQSIALSDIVGTAPFFSGQLTANTAAGLTAADYMLFTSSDFQLTPDEVQHWIGAATPVMTITAQGQPYAWLYPNQAWSVEQEHFNAQHQPADALITDFSSMLAQSQGAQVVSEMDEAAASGLLTQIAQTHDRVWVIHYAATPRRVLDPIVQLLDTHAVTLDEWSSPLSEGALYALPTGVSFATKPVTLNGDVNFGDHVHLHDAQLLVPRVQPGQAIGIFSHWTATGPAAQLEVSVVDEAGHVWGSSAIDVPLQEAEPRPRGRRLSVPVPLTMPPGNYHLVLTVVDMASGSPINTRGNDGSTRGIDWSLGSVTIDPAQTLIDPATRKPSITLNVDLGGITPVGTERPPNPIVSGDPWTLAMEWTATADHLPALDVRWEWVRAGTVVYSTTLPLNPYSTEQWRKGEVLQSKYDFRVPIDVKNGAYDLQFKVIERASGRPLNDKAIRLTSVNVASRPRDFTAPAAAYPLGVKFDEAAKLIGADVERSGGVLTVTLFWQGQTITTTNDTAFVQLIGPEGSIEQQIDNWQIAFDAPTSTWLPGQVIADRYKFAVSSGGLQIGVGLYNAANGERLPAFDAMGQRLPQDRMVFAVK